MPGCHTVSRDKSVYTSDTLKISTYNVLAYKSY